MRRVLVIFAGIVILFGFVLAILYFAKPTKLIVTSCASCQIKVAKTDNGAQLDAAGFPRSVQASFSSTLIPAEYTITVTDQNSDTASRRIKLAAHHALKISLVPQPMVAIQQVASGDAYGLAASDASHLFFVQSSNGGLYELVGGSVKPIDVSRAYLRVGWANSGYGVAQDQNGSLYVVSGGSVTPLPLPEASTSSFPNFAVAPDRQIYIAVNSTIYRGTQGSSFQKFASLDSGETPTFLAAAGGNLVLLNNADSPDEGSGQVITYDSGGKKTVRSGGSFLASWSADGGSLVVSAGKGAEVLDARLRQTDLVPSGAVTNVAWISNTTFAYTYSNQVWLYETSTQSSRLLATNGSGGAITQLSASADKSTLFLVARPGVNSSDASAFIGKISLPAQP